MFNIIKIKANDFSLSKTMNSGSPITFIFRQVGDYYYIPYNNLMIKVKQSGSDHGYSELIVDYFPKTEEAPNEIEKAIYHIFDLSFNYQNFINFAKTDNALKLAVQNAYGIRVTQTSPWEALLCMVVSQQNRITKIRNTIQKFMESFGKRIVWGKNEFYTFPSYDALFEKSETWKDGFALGYRYAYVEKIVEQLHHGKFNLDELGSLNYEEAKNKLMSLYGVGDKISDAVLVFGYGKKEGFIIDTWIKKIMRKYFIKNDLDVGKTHSFALNRWKYYSSYVNQTIYFSRDIF